MANQRFSSRIERVMAVSRAAGERTGPHGEPRTEPRTAPHMMPVPQDPGLAQRAKEMLRQRVVVAALMMATAFLLGIVGFEIIGGSNYTFLDSVYMTAITLTTTGFREVIDVSRPSAQVFTIFLLIFGAGTVVYFTSVMTAFVVEGDLTQGFRRRRMQRMIGQLNGHYIVCGAGPTGLTVLRELLTTQRPVVVVEHNQEITERLELEFPGMPVVNGDFTDDTTMAEAGIVRAAGVVICTSDDKSALVAIVTARQMNPRVRVIARGPAERHARLRAAGADAVVSTDLIGGMRMASELVRPHVVGFLDTMLRDRNRNLRVEEVEIPTGSGYAGKRVADLALRDAGNLLLMGLRLAQGEYVYIPEPEQRVEAGMQLIVMGDPVSVEKLRASVTGNGATATTTATYRAPRATPPK